MYLAYVKINKGDIMGGFFTENFNISKIVTCVHVFPGGSKLIHTDRPSHGLVVNLGGRNRYIFSDGREMTVEKGTLFYLPKFSSYRVVKEEEGECIAVNFELADADITYPVFSINSARYGIYVSLIKDLLEAWNKKAPGYLNICFAKLYEMICEIQAETGKDYIDSRGRDKAILASEYILKRLDDSTLTIFDVSDMLGISPEYFRKIFENVYGISPKKYILNLRMERAKELLLSGELTVGAVGRMCGYEDESYFSREFKRICGCAPSKFV